MVGSGYFRASALGVQRLPTTGPNTLHRVYVRGVERAYLLQIARRARGLTQVQLATKAGTSQAALSAYERGLKSPSLKVAARILEATGHDFTLRVHIDWVQHALPGDEPFWVPSILWRADDTPDCFATLRMPDLLHPEAGVCECNMRHRDQRKAAYEHLIRRGSPQQMLRFIDAALLVDLWDDLELPEPVREAWKWQVIVERNSEVINLYPGYPRSEDWITASAWMRAYEPLPKEPPKPPQSRVRFIRTRFDPRPSSVPPGSPLPPRPEDPGMEVVELD